MPSFSLTNMAKADLKEIARFTQNRWGREQRNLYLQMLDVSFQQLAANPLKGKDCSDIRIGYRKLNAGSHVIFYRQTLADTIEIPVLKLNPCATAISGLATQTNNRVRNNIRIFVFLFIITG